MDVSTTAALYDELEKIAVSSGLLQRAAEKSMQRAGGKLTAQAQKFHAAAWGKQQAAKAALAPRLKAYQAAAGRVAKKPDKPGLLSRLFGGAPQPALAGA